MCKLCSFDYIASLTVSSAPAYTIDFPISAAKLLLHHAPTLLIRFQLRNWVIIYPIRIFISYLWCASSWNYSDQQSSRHSPCPDANTWLLSVNLVYEYSQKYLDLSLISCKFNFTYQQLDVGNSLSDKRAFLCPLKFSPSPLPTLSHLIPQTHSQYLYWDFTTPLFSNLLWKEDWIECQLHHTAYPMKKSIIKCFSSVKFVLHKNEEYLNESRDRTTW